MKSVYDIDGARYDYQNVGTATYASLTPGNHAIYQWDGGCGFTWTKKRGVTYYFYANNPSTSCPGMAAVGGYAGRLHQIIDRNRNTYLTFNYTWDNGDASVNGKINTIAVQAESGLTTTLSFADYSGRRLLQQITYPDGLTTVQYGYDASGNLTTVSRPPNNASGSRPLLGYGYQGIGSDSVMQWVASPRWMACGGGCGYDGGYLYFLFSGTSASASTLSTIYHGAVVNPPIADGTNTPLQPGYVPQAGNYSNFLIEFYTTGITTPTLRDTDGHIVNWVVDGLGKPTQTQVCTASVAPTQQCIDSSHWLVMNETWDASNNLTAEVDPRGYETDYAYDASGDTIAVAESPTTTSLGTFRPTRLFDYDQFNNVVAYCDQVATHTAGADWVQSPTPSDSRCTALAASVPHLRASYVYPSYEPSGELSSMTTPLGYTRRFSYAPSQQGGLDYGLPTAVTGDSFTQIDGSTIAPTQTFWYDAQGVVRCFSKGQGIAVTSADILGRTTMIADPDDSSANAASICGKSGGQGGWNTQTTYSYYPDGALQSSQTPAERAGGVSTAFTYDLDGNVTTETRHHGCTPGGSCTAGVTTKWYDGADRLVEVALPHDGFWDYYASNWLTRHIYDLSGGGAVSIGGASFRAYGNLYKTQEWVPPSQAGNPSWTDLRGSAFDALNRETTKYGFSPSSSSTLRTTTKLYDASAATLGLLASATDPLGQTTTFAYDSAARTTSVQFSGDGGVTPNKTFVYDPSGRIVSSNGALYGTEVTRYDADGRLVEVDEPTSGSLTSPASITYDYYPNGQRKDINVISSALNAAPFLSYAYRIDGTPARLRLGLGLGDFATTYTDAGRAVSRSDPFTGATMPNPRAPVAAGSVYGPTTWAYDVTGQLATITLPQTFSYLAINHDDEGNLTAWNGSYSTNGPAGMTYTQTIRGENVFQGIGNAQSAAYRAKIANGAAVRMPVPIFGGSGPPVITGPTTLDPINAVVTSTSQHQYVPNSDPEFGPRWLDCGIQTTAHNFDAASRKVSKTVSMNVDTTNPDCVNAYDAGPTTTPVYSYDAENHTIAANAIPFDDGGLDSVQWSPGGHAYKIGSANIHYDGGQILFITNADGTLRQTKAGTLADNYPSAGLQVIDRGVSNEYVSKHNNVFYGGVSIGTTIYRNKDQVTQTIPYIFLGSTNDPLCSPPGPSGARCGPAGNFEYARLEGFEYGGTTFQGARTVDEDTGAWTTPDAYAGNVHDPMSSKSFMWDGNNPYAYSDPSGFAIQRNETADVNGSWTMPIGGVNGSSSDQESGWDKFKEGVENVLGKIEELVTPKIRISTELWSDIGPRLTKTQNAAKEDLSVVNINSAITEAQTGRPMYIAGSPHNHINHIQAGIDSIKKTVLYLEGKKVSARYRGTADAVTIGRLQQFYLGQAERIRGYFRNAGVENAVRW